jgi:hypothetical protein
MVWLGASVLGTCGREVAGVLGFVGIDMGGKCADARVINRGLRCLGPFSAILEAERGLLDRGNFGCGGGMGPRVVPPFCDSALSTGFQVCVCAVVFVHSDRHTAAVDALLSSILTTTLWLHSQIWGQQASRWE